MHRMCSRILELYCVRSTFQFDADRRLQESRVSHLKKYQFKQETYFDTRNVFKKDKRRNLGDRVLFSDVNQYHQVLIPDSSACK